MTPEQIERLREWHKQTMKSKMVSQRKRQIVLVGLTHIQTILGIDLFIKNNDHTKIYFYGELISEVRE